MLYGVNLLYVLGTAGKMATWAAKFQALSKHLSLYVATDLTERKAILSFLWRRWLLGQLGWIRPQVCQGKSER